MPLHSFLLMNMYTILKSHTKSSSSICFKTFPILNCCSNNSDNVFINGQTAKI